MRSGLKHLPFRENMIFDGFPGLAENRTPVDILGALKSRFLELGGWEASGNGLDS